MHNTVMILFVFIILIIITRNKENPLSKSLFLLYAFTFIGSILLELFFSVDQTTNAVAMIYLFIILLLWILPFNKIGLRSLYLMSYSRKRVLFVSSILVVLSLLSIVYFTYFTVSTFLSGELFSVRQDVAAGSDYVRGGFIMNFFSTITPLYHICLLLYFIALKDCWPALIRNLLFISSLSFPVHVLTSFGRDGIVFWFINLVILYFMFHKLLSERSLSILKYKFIAVAGTLIIIFCLMTYIRFGLSSINFNIYEGNVFYSLLDYIGQQPRNFSSAFESNYRSSAPYFPTFKAIEVKIFGIGELYDSEDDPITMSRMGLLSDYNVFGYFVKSIMWKSGKMLTVIISVVFCLVVMMTRYLYRTKYRRLSLLLILFTLFQVPMNGVFYFRQSVGSFDAAYFLLLITSAFLIAKKA